MADIAGEVGVSVRTLHRYFPSKADIVWGGIESSFEALRAAFETADERLSVIEAVRSVVMSVFDQQVEDLALTRIRLRLIATVPELQASRSETFERWREQLVAYVARRLGEPEDAITPVAAGAAIQAAMLRALAWWAVREEDASPADVVAQALRGLEKVASL